MMESIAKIDWSDITEAFPAFVTIIGIPLTGSINDGIAFGFIFYVILKYQKTMERYSSIDVYFLQYYLLSNYCGCIYNGFKTTF